MAKTLARSISRIGLLPSAYSPTGERTLNYDPEISDKGRDFIAAGLRDEARKARVKMREELKKHRKPTKTGVSQFETKSKQPVNEPKSKPKK